MFTLRKKHNNRKYIFHILFCSWRCMLLEAASPSSSWWVPIEWRYAGYYTAHILQTHSTFCPLHIMQSVHPGYLTRIYYTHPLRSKFAYVLHVLMKSGNMHTSHAQVFRHFSAIILHRTKIAHLSTSGFLSSIVCLWYLSLCSRNLLLVVNFFLHEVQS